MDTQENYLLSSNAVKLLGPAELQEFGRSPNMDLTGLVLVVCKMIGTQPVPQRVLRAGDRLSGMDRLQLWIGLDRYVGYLVSTGEARPFSFQATFRLSDNVSELDTTIELYFRILDVEKVVRDVEHDPLKRLCGEVRAELRKFFKRIPHYQDVAARIGEGESQVEALGERPHLGLAVERASIDFQLPEHVRLPLGEIVKSQIQRDLEEQKRLDSEANLAKLEAEKREAIRKEEIAIEIEAAKLRASQSVLDSQRERERLEAEVERERIERQLALERQRKAHELDLLQMEMKSVDPNNPVALLLRDPEFRRSYLEMLHNQEMEKIKQMSAMQVKQIEQDKQIELRFAEARLELIRNFLNAKGEILEREDLERLLQMLDEGRPGVTVVRPPLMLTEPARRNDERPTTNDE
jgi:hypothetical protein